MKGILEFNVDDPLEKDGFMMAANALDAYLCLLDIDNYLRDQIKYHDKEWGDIREKLHEFLISRGVDMDLIY